MGHYGAKESQGVPVLSEVVVRQALPKERLRWAALMDTHRYLEIKQDTGRGLSHVAEWNGEWLAPMGRKIGYSQCRPRDEWLG